MQTRVRTSRDERLALVAEQESSGMTAMAFCRERGLGYQNFLRWKRTLADRPTPGGPVFVELAVEPATPARVPAPLVVAELSLGADIILRIFNPSSARR
jgi:transposase-like protein